MMLRLNKLILLLIQEQLSDLFKALQMYLERKYRSKSSAMLGNVMAILTNLRNISATTLQIQLTQLQKMGTVFFIFCVDTFFFVLIM